MTAKRLIFQKMRQYKWEESLTLQILFRSFLRSEQPEGSQSFQRSSLDNLGGQRGVRKNIIRKLFENAQNVKQMFK